MLRQIMLHKILRTVKTNFSLAPLCIRSASNNSPADSVSNSDSFGHLEAPLESRLRQNWLTRRSSSKSKNLSNDTFPKSVTGSELKANIKEKMLNSSDMRKPVIVDTPEKGRDLFGDLNSPLETSFKQNGFKRTNRTRIGYGQTAGETNSHQLKPKNLRPDKRTPSSQVYIKNSHSDVFGDLAKDDPKYKMEPIMETEFPDDDDPVQSRVFKPDAKRKRFVDYSQDIRNLSKEKKVKEAIELFDSLGDLGVAYQKDTMLFTNIIAVCGRYGYTKKAFQIYRTVRDRGLKPTGPMLTALFNACAECPFPDYGLQKAQLLYLRLTEQGWQPNQKTYHAMIKAFGRCQDLATAFQLVDKMREEELNLTEETFSFLLQACISNKEAGFSHAVSVFRKMNRMRIKTDVFCYNLLLRATRDCSVGPPEISCKLILEWPPEKPKLVSPQPERLLLKSPKNEEDLSKDSKTESINNIATLETPSRLTVLPDDKLENNVVLREVVVDILSPCPEKTDIVALGEVRTSADRLALLGGATRILNKLAFLNQKANIQTFTLLLECQESTLASEEFLLEQMVLHGVKPDIDFFNVLIKKRCFRWDYQNAREVLNLINENGLYPDIATYGTLAMTCKTKSTTAEFLKDMEVAGSTPNIQILGTLMRNASYAMNFGWILDLMFLLTKYQMKPDEKFLYLLEKAWKNGMKASVQLERDAASAPPWAKKEVFKEKFKKFCLCYKTWLKNVQVEVAQHPWNQFQPEPKAEKECNKSE